jgi:uncharacterized membrane protein
MATRSSAIRKPITPDILEKILAAGAVLILLATITAIIRGQNQWAIIPANVWAHLATIGIALSLTPVMLLRKRGDKLHRILGMIWLSTMFLTAMISFDIRLIDQGRFSLIHILSLFTLIQVPLIFWHAKNHNIDKHRTAVRGMVLGALLIAGFFTFPFGRLLGTWLFGV